MKTSQFYYDNGRWDFSTLVDSSLSQKENLIFLYLDRLQLDDNPAIIDQLIEQFPQSRLITQTTSGNILNDATISDLPVASLLHFEKSRFEPKIYSFRNGISEFELGVTIINDLLADDLKHILLLPVGNEFNSRAIIEGINEALGSQSPITVSGGISGDDNRFEQTFVGLDKEINDHSIVCVGLYGEELTVQTNSTGGWKAFGPKRTVTKSYQNVLYEIDSQPAVNLYKKYLGEEFAKELPEAALLFPLEVTRKDEDVPLVRTIIQLDDENNSMTFAGDIPEGSSIRLMRTNTDEIILASGRSIEDVVNSDSEVLFLVSCAGRRWILNSRTEEEIEEIKERIPANAFIFGFYSYGEISMSGIKTCEVFNQTMTITVLSEKV